LGSSGIARNRLELETIPQCARQAVSNSLTHTVLLLTQDKKDKAEKSFNDNL